MEAVDEEESEEEEEEDGLKDSDEEYENVGLKNASVISQEVCSNVDISPFARRVEMENYCNEFDKFHVK